MRNAKKKNPKSYLRWGLSLGQLPFHSDNLLSELTWHSCFFSDFVFKIRLIRLGFLCKQKKLLYLNSQSTDS